MASPSEEKSGPVTGLGSLGSCGGAGLPWHVLHGDFTRWPRGFSLSCPLLKDFLKTFRQGLTYVHSQIATCRAPESRDSSCNILGSMLVPCGQALWGKDGGVKNRAFSAPGNCHQWVCPPGNRSLPSNASPEFNQIFGDTLPLFLSGTYTFMVEVCFSVFRKIKGRNVPI